MANRIAAQEDQLAPQLAGGFDGDLLSQHGTDGEFKSIPASPACGVRAVQQSMERASCPWPNAS